MDIKGIIEKLERKGYTVTRHWDSEEEETYYNINGGLGYAQIEYNPYRTQWELVIYSEHAEKMLKKDDIIRLFKDVWICYGNGYTQLLNDFHARLN